MKIKKILIKNIGPYTNENQFVFDVDNNLKRMILIGGKNGAGKTTLFNAIKICMYGCTTFGFNSNTQKYFEEIQKIINTNEKLKKVGESQIIIDLLLDDGMYNHVYKFDRKWKISGSKIIESFDLYKDNEKLSVNEKNDFQSFLLQMLPPNLFRFYFFDGEKISDFIFNSNKNSDFKNAFLKLCNLDTLDIICENFKRISKNKTKEGINFSEMYDKALENYNLISQRVDYAKDEYDEISNTIMLIDEQLASLEKDYAKNGGISKKEWKSMMEQISKEEIRRDDYRKWLKDVANNILPFIIVKSKLSNLKFQIEEEHKSQVVNNLKDIIDTPEIKEIINKVIASTGNELSKDISKAIVNEIISYSEKNSDIVPILNLSEFDRYELISKINGLLSFDIERIKTVTDDIDASLKCVKRIRKKIEKSSVENYDSYLQIKSDLNENKSKEIKKLLEIDKELQEYRAKQSVSFSKLNKAKLDYENLLKKQSIHDISARALLAFNEIQQSLYNKNIHLVEEEFKKNFRALINKSDLIDGIYIDNNLNVLPYKNKTFVVEDLKKLIQRNGEEILIAQIGLHAFEIMTDKISAVQDFNSDITLPVEVKQQLSAGEKQIFIMALYQSLSKLNVIKVPYIVDTPFARIDKEHREKILKEFFKNLSGQVIILSTDEEIVGKYKESIDDVISNTYLLDHTINGNTEIITNSYFGGVYDK